MTHRLFAAWTAWLKLEWNRPSRTDQYVMSLTAEVRRILHKHPQRVKLKDFLLIFNDGKGQPKLTEEQAADYAMAKWLGPLGGLGAVRIMDEEGQEYRLPGPDEQADEAIIVDEGEN